MLSSYYLDGCTFTFSHSSYKREVDKWKKFLKYYRFKMTWTASFYCVFLHLACFVVNTYMIFISVCWILMSYSSSTTYLFTRLQKTFNSCEPKEKWPHTGLYNYNGRQIELFHMKWFNGGEINRALGDIFVKRLRLVLVYRPSCKFNNNLRTSK